MSRSPPLPGQASVYLGYYDAGDNIYQKIAPGETQARIERSGLTEEARLDKWPRMLPGEYFASFRNILQHTGSGNVLEYLPVMSLAYCDLGPPCSCIICSIAPRTLQRLQQSSSDHSDHYSTLSYNFTATAITPTIGILSVSAVTLKTSETSS